MGSFIQMDADTQNQKHLNVARFLVQTRCEAIIDELVCVNINGVLTRLKLVEDPQGRLRVVSLPSEEVLFSSFGS